MLDTNASTLSSRTLTQERHERRLERTAKASGYGTTDAGIAIVTKYLEDTKDILSLTYDNYRFQEGKGSLKKNTYNGYPRDIFMLDPYVVSSLGIQTGISSVMKNDSLSKTLFALAMALEDEVYAHMMRNWDDIKAERIRKEVRKRGSVSVRNRCYASFRRSRGRHRRISLRHGRILARATLTFRHVLTMGNEHAANTKP